MMDADQITDRLTGKMLDSSISAITKAATQIAEALMFFIFSAAATATDPFFRKNMGERYFTPIRMVISLAGWGTMLFAGVLYNSFLFGSPAIGFLVGVAICFAYLMMAMRNITAIQKRQATGELWHSKCRGESLFGEENAIRDFTIEIIVLVLLVLISIPHAAFFLLSRLMAYMAEAAALNALYNRYLDIQDAKIEADFLETTLREGFPPRQTAGLYRPLPQRLSRERRGNIARIVTGGPFVAPPADQPVAPGSSGAKTQPPPTPAFAASS